jgi:glycosyltransferase involved in cell wall biosynthesis
MPNFVDTEQFRPCRDDAERGAARREWNVPEDAFVVGCVAALKREHKRVDALISECARVVREASSGGPGARLFLLAAGAATADTPALQAQAARELGGRACLLSDVTRERMASLYRCMDVFVLPSLFEMMPIAVLEAMASGVPVIANRHPVLEWMVGDAGRIDHRLQTTDYRPVEGEGLRSKLSESAVCCLSSVVHSDSAGCCIDMGKDGELAACLAGLGREWLEETGAGARRRAMALFSKEAVVGRYVEYYGRVLRRVG